MSDNLIEKSNRGLNLSTNGSANLSTNFATTGGANTFINNARDVNCGLGGALSVGGSPVPQISNHPNLDTSTTSTPPGTNVVRSNSCPLANALTFVPPVPAVPYNP